MAYGVSTVTAIGATLLASATAADKLILVGCDATTEVLTQQQAVAVTSRPTTPYSTTSRIFVEGAADNHVYVRAIFVAGESTGGDANTLYLYGHSESDPNTTVVLAVLSSATAFHLPMTGDVANTYGVLFDVIYTVASGAVETINSSAYATYAEFKRLKDRTVTTHKEADLTHGEDQTIYGEKSFKNKMSFPFTGGTQSEYIEMSDDNFGAKLYGKVTEESNAYGDTWYPIEGGLLFNTNVAGGYAEHGAGLQLSGDQAYYRCHLANGFYNPTLGTISQELAGIQLDVRRDLSSGTEYRYGELSVGTSNAGGTIAAGLGAASEHDKGTASIGVESENYTTKIELVADETQEDSIINVQTNAISSSSFGLSINDAYTGQSLSFNCTGNETTGDKHYTAYAVNLEGENSTQLVGKIHHRLIGSVSAKEFISQTDTSCLYATEPSWYYGAHVIQKSTYDGGAEIILKTNSKDNGNGGYIGEIEVYSHEDEAFIKLEMKENSDSSQIQLNDNNSFWKTKSSNKYTQVTQTASNTTIKAVGAPLRFGDAEITLRTPDVAASTPTIVSKCGETISYLTEQTQDNVSFSWKLYSNLSNVEEQAELHFTKSGGKGILYPVGSPYILCDIGLSSSKFDNVYANYFNGKLNGYDDYFRNVIMIAGTGRATGLLFERIEERNEVYIDLRYVLSNIVLGNLNGIPSGPGSDSDSTYGGVGSIRLARLEFSNSGTSSYDFAPGSLYDSDTTATPNNNLATVGTLYDFTINGSGAVLSAGNSTNVITGRWQTLNRIYFQNAVSGNYSVVLIIKVL
jgi:hypothetical protein